MGNNQLQNKNNQKNISRDRFMTLWEKELDLKKTEAQYMETRDKRQYEFATNSLEKKSKYEEKKLEYKYDGRKKKYWFVGSIVFLSLTFLLIVFHIGYASEIIDFIKESTPFAISVIGGYFGGRYHCLAKINKKESFKNEFDQE